MISFETILPHFPGFILVLTRLAGMFLFTPMFSAGLIPRRFLVYFAGALAVIIYPTLDHATMIPLSVDVFALAPMMVSELVIGGTIGLIASIPLMTAQLAGVIMGQQMGLGLATVFNPAVDIEGDSIGQMLFFVAISGFLIAGGLEVLFSTLVSTFSGVPLGGFAVTEAPLGMLVGIVNSGFEVALRIALPVLVILFMENVAMGFVMKTIPSLNIMSFGFPIKIIAGLLVVIGGIGFMMEVVMSEVSLDMATLQDWASSLR